ncbi:U4/U6.U5 tri-snRNP-associated protein 2, partial [Tremellales sp. Uapishka_1]
MASPASSPPAAKRIKLDPSSSNSGALPLSPSASPHKSNGYLNGSSGHAASPPLATSAPPLAEASILSSVPVPSSPPSSDDEEEPVHIPEEEDLGRRDMYLDTVERRNLDFDFERLCSKSLSNINVYACLFYVLPEGYPVSDPSLNDILHVLNPRFKGESLVSLSTLPSPSYTLSSQPYLPGYIGLNNIKQNDYLNVVIHLLLHVPPLRSFLLNPNTPQLSDANRPTELVKRLATLARRLWNPRLFKAQVSPHEFLQEVAKRSAGKFKITEQGDPVEFLGWIVNTLHRDLGGSKKKNSSVIYSTFQGKVKIETQQVITHKDAARPIFDIGRGVLSLYDKTDIAKARIRFLDIQTISSPFLFLALDLPATPLFQDMNEKKIIPQVPLSAILAKFDGKTTQEFGPTLKRHHLTSLPPYLILHIKRFTKNNFVEEKNPTIVNFPLRGVELNDYVEEPQSLSTVYDLLSNVTLSSTLASTSSTSGNKKSTPKDQDADINWKIHVRAGKGGGEDEKWLEMQDLRVEEVRKEMVFLGETVIQVWERR